MPWNSKILRLIVILNLSWWRKKWLGRKIKLWIDNRPLYFIITFLWFLLSLFLLMWYWDREWYVYLLFQEHLFSLLLFLIYINVVQLKCRKILLSNLLYLIYHCLFIKKILSLSLILIWWIWIWVAKLRRLVIKRRFYKATAQEGRRVTELNLKL